MRISTVFIYLPLNCLLLLSCWQRNCRQVTSSDRASRAMMASLMDTLCCLTHIPACNAVGVVSPSLLELQLLPAEDRQNLFFKVYHFSLRR